MRKAKPKKRVILPDPVFNDKKVSKFVNHLMYDGKKSISYEIFYNALENVKAKMQNEEKSALEIWKQALDNITPQVEVKSRRIGGATFQVPTEIRPDRKESISMKNMIAFARKRSGKSMADKLAAEIMDAFNNQGGPFTLMVDDVVLTNVMVGDVWLFSGQSNVDVTIERVYPQYVEEIDAFNLPDVRLFRVQNATNTHAPQDDISPSSISWRPLTKQNAWLFSALGSFYGKRMFEKTGVAQGIIINIMSFIMIITR